MPRGRLPGTTRARGSVASFMKGTNAGQKVQRIAKNTFKKELAKFSEKKFNDTHSTNTALDIDYDASTTIFSLSDMVQSDADVGARDGDKVKPLSIEYNVRLDYNNAALANTAGVQVDYKLGLTIQVVRFIIFRWHPFSGSDAPSVGEIIHYFGEKDAPLSPLVHDGRNQFNVLLDKRITLDWQRPCRVIKGIKGLKNSKMITFKNASSTNGTDKIYAFFVSDAITGGGVYPALRSYAFRLNYYDM